MEVTCWHCRKTFVPKRKSTEAKPVKYCSHSCGKAARRKVDPEKYAEKDAEYKRKWRKVNPEKDAEYKRKRRKVNLEKDAEYKRKWREANREKERLTRRKWREANPEKVAEHNTLWRNKAASANSIAHVANEIRKLKGNQDD